MRPSQEKDQGLARVPWRVRALGLLALLLVIPPAVGAEAEEDTRRVLANHVHPTRCPTYETPATVACFTASGGAARAEIEVGPVVDEAKDVTGDAQPRMVAWAYNGTRLVATSWMCDDGVVEAPGATLLVVAIQTDRRGCSDDRLPVIAAGTLRVRWE